MRIIRKQNSQAGDVVKYRKIAKKLPYCCHSLEPSAKSSNRVSISLSVYIVFLRIKAATKIETLIFRFLPGVIMSSWFTYNPNLQGLQPKIQTKISFAPNSFL